MSKTSCAARCSRGSVQGVLRAPAEGEGGVAHREDLAATASATLERSTGTVAHGKRAARERRRRRSKVSRRRRAGHAPPARRVGGACACRARSNGRRRPLVVVVRTPTPNYLRQASPDRGKYTRVTLEYAQVTLDGVTALDLLCSPPSEFFGAHHRPDMTASVTTDRNVYMSE